MIYAIDQERIHQQIDIECRKKKQAREEIKSQHVKWLASFDTKHHLTLTFPKDTNEYWTRRLLNQTIRHLNRSIYKGRYRRGESYLNGFAIRERTFAMNTDHYHILIHEGTYVPEREVLNHIMRKQVEYTKGHSIKGFKKKNYLADHYLQPYINEGKDRLENYLLKQFEFLSHPLQKAYDAIGILGPDEVSFGG